MSSLVVPSRTSQDKIHSFSHSPSYSPEAGVSRAVMAAVAIRATWVPGNCGVTTSPGSRRRETCTVLILSIKAGIESRGTSPSVRTGNRGKSAKLVLTVVVRVRLGLTNSLSAYPWPRGHLLPLTRIFPSRRVTSSLQPRGHSIHTSVFIPSPSQADNYLVTLRQLRRIQHNPFHLRWANDGIPPPHQHLFTAEQMHLCPGQRTIATEVNNRRGIVL